LVSALIRESGDPTNTVAYDAFASPWKTYTHVISNVTDPNIIAAITNKKIKISRHQHNISRKKQAIYIYIFKYFN
jgi:hypothetical protein